MAREKQIFHGHLANTERDSVRVRISGNDANLNIKSMTLGVTRTKYEYPIPMADAREMIDVLCLRPIVEKNYYLERDQHIWEIDVFAGINKGLIVAEIELHSAEEKF